MVAELGIDFLAAGIGNIHGKYPDNWEGLSFETLDAIQKLTGDCLLYTSEIDKRVEETESLLLGEIDKRVEKTENLLLDEIGRTQVYLENKIDMVKQNIDELNQYYRITKLENENTTLLLQMITDLKREVEILKQKIA